MRGIKIMAIIGVAVMSGLVPVDYATAEQGNANVDVVHRAGVTEYIISDPDGLYHVVIETKDRNLQKGGPLHVDVDEKFKDCPKKATFTLSNLDIIAFEHWIFIWDCQTEGRPFDSMWEIDNTGGVRQVSQQPTATQWGLIALAVFLAGSLAWMIRRRVTVRPAGAA